MSYLFAFSYCLWGSQVTNTEVVCHSILQWTTFCQNSTMTCLSWVALHKMAHSFIELDKAVVHVIRLVSFLWLLFLSVCPLIPSLSAYCLTGVLLTLDVGYPVMAPTPDLGCGIYLLLTPPVCSAPARCSSTTQPINSINIFFMLQSKWIVNSPIIDKKMDLFY